MNEDDCRCEDFVARLFQLFDAELEEGEITRLHHHIETCPQCHEVADAEQHIRRLIRRSCSERAPESLRTRVITQITVLRTQRFAIEEQGF